jgi:LPS-assembly protein
MPRYLLFLLSLLLLAGAPLRSETDKRPKIKADETNYTEEAMSARGHVEAVWEDYIIYADSMDYDFKSRQLVAAGRVTMSSKDTVLSGEKLSLNLKTRSGEMVEAFGLVSPYLGYETDRLVQKSVDTFTFDRLKLTSCAQIVPRWRITCRKGTIKKDRYVDMRSVWFKIKGMPFLYLPAMRYPLDKNGRATGLLFPNVGTSSERGFMLLDAFFWDIRPNMDLTLSTDYYSKLGVGLGGEGRYLFRRASGDLKFYSFRYNDAFHNDSTRSEFEKTLTSDYYIDAEHKQEFGFLRSRLVVQVHQQSRPDFMRLLSNSFDVSINTNFMTSAQWSSSWRNISLAVMGSRSEKYYNQLDKSYTMKYLPQVILKLEKQRIASLPVYFSLRTQYDNYTRGGVSYEDEAEYVTDINSKRLTLTPSLDMQLLKLPFLRFSVNTAAKVVRYDKRRDPDTHETIEAPIWANYKTAEATLLGPVFARQFRGRTTRFKHVIEPAIKARYATKVTNSDELLAVDSLDNPSYSYAGLTLTSRLFMKKYPYSGSPREIMTYSIGQDYYFDPKEANVNRTVNGIYPKFSVLSQTLRLRPINGLTLDARLDYHHTLNLFNKASVTLVVKPRKSPLSGSFSYSTYRSPYLSLTIYNRTLIGGSLAFDSASFPVKLSSGLDYDFTDREFRNAYVRATLDYQCVMLSGELKVYARFINNTLTTDTMFRFTVALGNLGVVSDLFGGNKK